MQTAPATRAGPGRTDPPGLLPYSSLGRRAAALGVDLAVLLALGWLVMGAAGDAAGGRSTLRPPVAALILAVSAAYYVGMEARFGATVGKHLLGTRVVAEGGSPIDLPAAVIRNLLRIVDGLFGYLLGAVVASCSPRRQRIGDRVAGTFVVLTVETAERLARPVEQDPYAVPFPGEGVLVRYGPVGRAGGRERRQRRLVAAGLVAGATVLVGAGVLLCGTAHVHLG